MIKKIKLIIMVTSLIQLVVIGMEKKNLQNSPCFLRSDQAAWDASKQDFEEVKQLKSNIKLWAKEAEDRKLIVGYFTSYQDDSGQLILPIDYNKKAITTFSILTDFPRGIPKELVGIIFSFIPYPRPVEVIEKSIRSSNYFILSASPLTEEHERIQRTAENSSLFKEKIVSIRSLFNQKGTKWVIKKEISVCEINYILSSLYSKNSISSWLRFLQPFDNPEQKINYLKEILKSMDEDKQNYEQNLLLKSTD